MLQEAADVPFSYAQERTQDHMNDENGNLGKELFQSFREEILEVEE